jgi:hypothetical protein
MADLDKPANESLDKKAKLDDASTSSQTSARTSTPSSTSKTPPSSTAPESKVPKWFKKPGRE